MLDLSFWKGKRVLLTGHTGFKGSWLLLWLLELGSEVAGYSLPAAPAPNLFRQLYGSLGNRFVHLEADLADRIALTELANRFQPDVVLHLAAQPLVRISYEDPLGTWKTNLLGSLHLLEALKSITHPCAVVMVTTDKVYSNKEWVYGYRETDQLGGHDPYSASKAATEIAVASWQSSFCGEAPHQTPHLQVATARAGNVIGGGDWALDRIVPDAMRSLQLKQSIAVRSPKSTRPWQHVLEPLGGYLLLAERLFTASLHPCEAFNFGPFVSSNRTVSELVTTMLAHWPGEWHTVQQANAVHEASLLNLHTDKAYTQLGWAPCWGFQETVERTVNWYRDVASGSDPYQRSLLDLQAYQSDIRS